MDNSKSFWKIKIRRKLPGKIAKKHWKLCIFWVHANRLFSKFLNIFKASSERILIFQKLIESSSFVLHHTKKLFKNYIPFSHHILHFDKFWQHVSAQKHYFSELFLHFWSKFSTDFNFWKTHRIYYDWATLYSTVVKKFQAV